MANANDGHPPCYQRFPRDLRSSLAHETEDFALRYAWALDASWDDHWYGVGTPDQWCDWARVTASTRDEFLTALKRHTVEMADGTLVQMRMVSDRNALWDKSKQSSEAGKESARRRSTSDGRPFNGRSTTVNLAVASAVAVASAHRFKCKDGAFAPDENLLSSLRKAYPSLDAASELERASAWCETNPEKRKTRRGMPKFLNAWFARSAERRAPAQRDPIAERDEAEMAAVNARLRAEGLIP